MFVGLENREFIEIIPQIETKIQEYERVESA